MHFQFTAEINSEPFQLNTKFINLYFGGGAGGSSTPTPITPPQE